MLLFFSERDGWRSAATRPREQNQEGIAGSHLVLICF
jgi:hypothetical protein